MRPGRGHDATGIDLQRVTQFFNKKNVNKVKNTEFGSYRISCTIIRESAGVPGKKKKIRRKKIPDRL